MMQRKARAALRPTKARYESLKCKWDRRLRPLGGDPSTFRFDDFRQLRLSREEDWSDWLAWLLRTSETGAFAEVLFGQHMNRRSRSLVAQEVKREELTEDRKRRADIVVRWKSGQTTDIEVKIQDRQIEKTFETAMKLKGRSPRSKWYHFILLLDERMPDWHAVASNHADNEEIHAIPWDNVVLALRRCLWDEREPLVWRTWAWTFCGAIEKRILRLKEPNTLPSDEAELQMALSWLSLLNSAQEKTNAA
jgi:hypothetical protein